MLTFEIGVRGMRVRCNPFGAGVRSHLVTLDYSGPGRPTVRVWDDVAGHYTVCHRLSSREQRLIQLEWERSCLLSNAKPGVAVAD